MDLLVQVYEAIPFFGNMKMNECCKSSPPFRHFFTFGLEYIYISM